MGACFQPSARCHIHTSDGEAGLCTCHADKETEVQEGRATMQSPAGRRGGRAGEWAWLACTHPLPDLGKSFRPLGASVSVSVEWGFASSCPRGHVGVCGALGHAGPGACPVSTSPRHQGGCAEPRVPVHITASAPPGMFSERTPTGVFSECQVHGCPLEHFPRGLENASKWSGLKIRATEGESYTNLLLNTNLPL